MLFRFLVRPAYCCGVVVAGVVLVPLLLVEPAPMPLVLAPELVVPLPVPLVEEPEPYPLAPVVDDAPVVPEPVAPEPVPVVESEPLIPVPDWLLVLPEPVELPVPVLVAAPAVVPERLRRERADRVVVELVVPLFWSMVVLDWPVCEAVDWLLAPEL